MLPASLKLLLIKHSPIFRAMSDSEDAILYYGDDSKWGVTPPDDEIHPEIAR